MRYLFSSLVLVLLLAIGSATQAEDEAQPGERPNRGPEFRQRMLEKFDADGDGELSEAERATAREQHGRRRAEGEEGIRGERGDRPAGPEGRRGRFGGPGDQGPGGHGPPDPEKMFQRLDQDGDGQLSREEFAPLARMMQRMHERRGQIEGRRGEGRPGPDRRGAGRRGERGGRFGQGPPRDFGDRPRPPRERQREFGPPDPLQNSDDRPGPPRQGEGRRQREFGGPERGRGGHGPPSPDQIFNRFDADGNDQLSREEFGELVHTVHAMRQRRREHAEENRFHGERGPNSDRRGPPDQFQRRRPPRPDFD